MNPSDLNVSFQYQSIHYNVNLVQGKQTSQTIQINGISYAVLGDSEKLETAYEILRSLSLESIYSFDDLVDRLSRYRDITFASIKKTDSIGVKTLNSKYLNESELKNEEISFGAWMTEELSVLPNRQEQVAGDIGIYTFLIM